MSRNLDVAALPSPSLDEARRRHARWRFFQIVFVFGYIGVLFDIATTALGTARAGSLRAYEQNPLGSVLIGHLGWLGMLGGMTLISLIAYASCRVVYAFGPIRWLRIGNVVMLLIGVVRWLAVLTAIAYLLQIKI